MKKFVFASIVAAVAMSGAASANAMTPKTVHY